MNLRWLHLRNATAVIVRPVSLAILGLALAVEAAEPWTLERALDHAQAHSPDARLARIRITIAQSGLQQANATLWPQLQLQSSYTRTDQPMLVFGSILNQRAYNPALDFNDVPDMDNFNVRGVLTQPLYAGGGLKAGRDAARAGGEAARAEAETVRQTLAFEVTRAFHTVQKTREVIRAAEAAVHSLERHLDIAGRRVTEGTALKTEQLDLQVRLAQGREDLVRARNARTLAERALRNLLGLEETDFQVAEEVPDIAAPVAQEFFDPRPELAVMAERQHEAEALIRQARADYRPRISAFGSLDYDYGWRTDGDGQSYTVGVLAQWDLWDGRRTRGKVSAAEANFEATREQDRKVRLAIELEVEQARLQLQEANERLAVTGSAIALAEESASLTRARFEEGLALATQLIDAETALTTARVRQAEAATDRHIAIAALRKALGVSQLDAPNNTSSP